MSLNPREEPRNFHPDFTLPALSDTETVWSLGSQEAWPRGDEGSIIYQMFDLPSQAHPRASRAELMNLIRTSRVAAFAAEVLARQYCQLYSHRVGPPDPITALQNIMAPMRMTPSAFREWVLGADNGPVPFNVLFPGKSFTYIY